MAEAGVAIGMGFAGLLQGILEGAGNRMKLEREERRLKEARDQNTLERVLLKAADEHPDIRDNPAYQAFFQEAFGPKGKKGRETGATSGESLINFMRLKGAYDQAIESRKGTENKELIAQGRETVLGVGETQSLGKSTLPGGKVTRTGPPEPSFGKGADAMLWQKFRKRPSEATEAESNWAKEQAAQDEIAQEKRKRAPIRAEQLSDAQAKAIQEELLSLRSDVKGARDAESERKLDWEVKEAGARTQVDIDVKGDPSNREKIETANAAREKGKLLGEFDPEILRRKAEQFANEQKQKRENELKRPLTVEEQKAYGADASWTLGDVITQAVQAMDEKDRAGMASITAAREAVSRMRYYASQVNDFGPASMFWKRPLQWVQDAAQTGDPEYRALANLTLEVRAILAAKGETGKAIAVEDIQMTADALANATLTNDYAEFLLDRIDTTLLESNKTIIDKYQPRSAGSLKQMGEDVEREIKTLKTPKQKAFEDRSKLYLYKGKEEKGAFTKAGWIAWAKEQNQVFREENLIPSIRTEGVEKPTAPIGPDTPLFMGGRPELGAFRLDQWDSVGKRLGIDLDGQHFYRTEQEAQENKEGGGPAKKAPGPQSRRGWRRGGPSSAKG